MTIPTTPSRPLRIAFYGRVARDDDGTEEQLAQQYEQCRRALPPGSITTVLYDVGPSEAGRKPAFDRITVGGRYARRDGGLDYLLAEAVRQNRRFDYLTASDPFGLSRDSRRANELLHRLRSASVRPLFPLGGGTTDTTDAINLLLSAVPAVDSARITRRAGAR
jgi:hypothetical protein